MTEWILGKSREDQEHPDRRKGLGRGSHLADNDSEVDKYRSMGIVIRISVLHSIVCSGVCPRHMVRVTTAHERIAVPLAFSSGRDSASLKKRASNFGKASNPFS